MSSRLNALLLPIDASEARELLSEWSWLIDLRVQRPLALTAFGDWFLEDRIDHDVSFLDTGMGDLAQVATSRLTWLRAARRPDRQQRWLLRRQFEQLEAEGVGLEPGECFSWLVPPVVGGGLAAANVEVTTIEVHQRFHARLCRRVRELSPTTVMTEALVAELVDELADELELVDAATELGPVDRRRKTSGRLGRLLARVGLR